MRYSIKPSVKLPHGLPARNLAKSMTLHLSQIQLQYGSLCSESPKQYHNEGR